MALTSNTQEVFRHFFGLKLNGYLRLGGQPSKHILIFEDGQGLVVCDNGSHWVMPKAEVAREVGRHVDRLADVSEALRDVLTLAGELSR